MMMMIMTIVILTMLNQVCASGLFIINDVVVFDITEYGVKLYMEYLYVRADLKVMPANT